MNASTTKGPSGPAATKENRRLHLHSTYLVTKRFLCAAYFNSPQLRNKAACGKDKHFYMVSSDGVTK